MSFDWSEYLDLAKEMTKVGLSSSQEAVLRCAISRAYYAAFCSSRNFALTEGATFKKTGEDHRLVPTYFTHSTDRKRQKIATKLKRLKDNRRQADYEDVVTSYKFLWQMSLQDAEYIINTLPHV
jgi:uncharacterized protein (UPF0332 family)